MTKCVECGAAFEIEDARAEYDSEFHGDPTYDDQFDEGVHCGGCAVSESESNLAQGRAILMMNGDEDYDDEFVQNNL